MTASAVYRQEIEATDAGVKNEAARERMTRMASECPGRSLEAPGAFLQPLGDMVAPGWTVKQGTILPKMLTLVLQREGFKDRWVILTRLGQATNTWVVDSDGLHIYLQGAEENEWWHRQGSSVQVGDPLNDELTEIVGPHEAARIMAYGRDYAHKILSGRFSDCGC